MRKQGPCFHCGVDSTPLWRNGPPEKPVLCNACGSRYRLGKSLENYTPKIFQVIRKKKRKAVPKAIVSDEPENITVTSNACFSSVLEDYASSESSTSHDYQICFPVKQEKIDETYPVENWGSLWGFPSRKRSPVTYSSLTTIQKLRRDLHKILRDEDPFDNACEGPEDDVLIFNININKLQIPSTEIGLGSILLKFPVTSQDDQQEIEPCPSAICGKVPCLNHAQMASPSLENGRSEDVEGVQNDQSCQEDQLEDDDHNGASPTMGAAHP